VQTESITTFYYRYLRYFLAKDDTTATPYDKYMSLAYAVRNQMVDKWIETQKRYHRNNNRRIYYLSMEYVLGKSLRHNIVNLGLEDSVADVAAALGISLEEIYNEEEECELGNGAKGAMAACIQEAMATHGLPAMGFGLHYDYSLFRQEIKNGMQVEHPFDWLHKGHPWETLRPEYACTVCHNGRLVQGAGWKNYDEVIAMPYDYPVPGYHNDTVNTIRLWAARPAEEFLPDYSNHGEYVRACEEASEAGRVTKVLYPDEDVRRATEMRIKQQYFLVSASLQDILRRFKRHNRNILDLDKKVALHLFGSRCALAVPELMRLLVDRESVPWKKAWELTKNTLTYTSNAVLRDNLENWPTYLIEQILPRHAQIIYDVNQTNLDEIRKAGTSDDGLIRELSLVDEGEVKRFRMANLAALGSHIINGVSDMQSGELSKRLFAPMLQAGSVSICNVTNGIGHRRWLLCANRPLANLINDSIGSGWATRPDELEKLSPFARNREFLFRLGDTKHLAKRRMCDEIRRQFGIEISAQSVFDIQIGRIHPLKRQVLHILNVLYRYRRLKNGLLPTYFRTHIFSGKAMPSDQLAKQVIKLISIVSKIVNEDPATAGKMSVVFIPDYNMTMGEYIIPAADISEQIATPHLEACATTNMKASLNGALTIASRCGSNIELAERIGSENIVMFGKTAGELMSMRDYRPWEIVKSDPDLKDIFAFIDSVLSKMPEGDLSVRPLLATIQDSDQYFILADFRDYVQKQDSIDAMYGDRMKWLATCVNNISRSGYFSSDRVIMQYSEKMWNVTP
jgi:starch phosphorylase